MTNLLNQLPFKTTWDNVSVSKASYVIFFSGQILKQKPWILCLHLAPSHVLFFTKNLINHHMVNNCASFWPGSVLCMKVNTLLWEQVGRMCVRPQWQGEAVTPLIGFQSRCVSSVTRTVFRFILVQRVSTRRVIVCCEHDVGGRPRAWPYAENSLRAKSKMHRNKDEQMRTGKQMKRAAEGGESADFSTTHTEPMAVFNCSYITSFFFWVLNETHAVFEGSEIGRSFLAVF